MSYDTTSTSTSTGTTAPQQSKNTTYNLDRLDNKVLPLNGMYHRTPNGGNGVTVYVLDSGLRSSHFEFATPTPPNTTSSANAPSSSQSSSQRAYCGFDALLHYESDIPCDDMNGHGTHVAGLIGGTTVGVANHVTIVAVKVAPKDFIFDGSAVLYGLQYVLLEKLRHPKKPMIVNMSFGGEHFLLLDFMVEALLTVNVTVVASAGNDGTNACPMSPAGVPGVITVGASNEKDFVPVWSNYGPCVDIYAPGTNIVSTSNSGGGDGSDSGSGSGDTTTTNAQQQSYSTRTGTSQSTPMVTGAVALYLQLQPTLTPSQVFHLILLDSIKNVLVPAGKQQRPSTNNSTSTSAGTNSSTSTATTTTTSRRIYKNRLLHTGIFTDPSPVRMNPTCPYSGRKQHLCYKEGWWIK